jgi:allophanate hydrolase subunit 1
MSMAGAIEDSKHEIERLQKLLSSTNLSDKERKSFEFDLAYEQKRLQDLENAVAERITRRAYA